MSPQSKWERMTGDATKALHAYRTGQVLIAKIVQDAVKEAVRKGESTGADIMHLTWLSDM